MIGDPGRRARTTERLVGRPGAGRGTGPRAGGSEAGGPQAGGPQAGGSPAGSSRATDGRRAGAHRGAARAARQPTTAGACPVRDAARAQARRRARRRPVDDLGLRRGWPDPQAGRPGRRRGGREARAKEPEPERRRPVRRPAASQAPARRPLPTPAKGAPRAGHHGEDAAAAAGDRPADDRVAAGVGAADHRAGGRHHPRRAAPCPGEGGVRAPRGRQADLPAVLREGDGRGAEAVPALNASIDVESKRDHLPRRTCTWRSPWTPPAACSCR